MVSIGCGPSHARYTSVVTRSLAVRGLPSTVYIPVEAWRALSTASLIFPYGLPQHVQVIGGDAVDAMPIYVRRHSGL